MADSRAKIAHLICPKCGQTYMAIAGSVRTCVGCKVPLVPVKETK
jgi:hypothetical protein